MGLDMYLNARRYVSEYNCDNYDAVNAVPIRGKGNMNVKTIECEAIYWRKANHIHKWFVDNVCGGEDDCRPHEVTVEKLRELSDLCKQTMKKKGKAAGLLPTSSGFFFGSVGYDNYYFEETQRTTDEIDKLLATDGIDRWDFFYQASW